jgi:hypothetical protein
MIYAFLRETRRNFDRPLRFRFQELSEFVFNKLWGERKIVFHDSETDLENDLRLLSKLGLVHYDARAHVVTMDPDDLQTLRKIAEGMRKDPARHQVPIIDEYLSRIETAIPA